MKVNRADDCCDDTVDKLESYNEIDAVQLQMITCVLCHVERLKSCNYWIDETEQNCYCHWSCLRLQASITSRLFGF